MTAPHSLQHIAFIPDGNRRWADKNKLNRLLGYNDGFKTVQKVCRWLPKYGIKYATFFLFSTENWKRSETEIKYLFKLFEDVFDDIKRQTHEEEIAVRVMGDISRLPKNLADNLRDLCASTKHNDKLTVTVGMSYGGRDEIIRAVRKIMSEAIEGSKSVTPEDIVDITEESFEKYLDTYGVVNPDIVVRTGERRLSNFLLWQSAYSEMFFLDKFWPDFNETDLQDLLTEYSSRIRRYGK